ncbi:hypothetical protein BKA57DRAFT_500580 [Linnemannia elongata]|nr:hypothetical protein BKA57DRAFT_500580 [Linnemannia elongata]
MPTKTSSDIAKVFLKSIRKRDILPSWTPRNQLSSKVTDRGVVGTFALFLLTRMPIWMWSLALQKVIRCGSQAGFREACEVKGAVGPIISPSEKKARADFEKRLKSTASI